VGGKDSRRFEWKAMALLLGGLTMDNGGRLDRGKKRIYRVLFTASTGCDSDGGECRAPLLANYAVRRTKTFSKKGLFYRNGDTEKQ
jgi:hypothetical protein